MRGYDLLQISDERVRDTIAKFCFSGRSSGDIEDYVWVKDRPMSQIIGPEDAVYCKIEDPTKSVVFDGLGRCTIALDRVTKVHDGPWRMTIATPGRILTETHSFTVTVKERG